MTEALDRAKIGRHQGERLVAASLAISQPAHGLLIFSIARQMKSSEALDRNDFPLAKPSAHFPNYIKIICLFPRIACRDCDRSPIAFNQSQSRAAIRTSVWLRMKAGLAGSSYSAWQSAHMWKSRMVV